MEASGSMLRLSLIDSLLLVYAHIYGLMNIYSTYVSVDICICKPKIFDISKQTH